MTDATLSAEAFAALCVQGVGLTPAQWAALETSIKERDAAIRADERARVIEELAVYVEGADPLLAEGLRALATERDESQGDV